MNYRTFTDSKGHRWEVWLVLPTSDERRAVERRVLADRRMEPRPLAPERRIAHDRRRFSFPRIGVSEVFQNGWLCFEGEDGEKRRLAPVPKGWNVADGEHLAMWCQAAKRVMKCGPPKG